MKKLLLSLFLSLMFAGITWADDTQTVTVDGADTGKTVKQITFNNATGISKPNQALDTNAVWYDLSGRRLPGVPTQSGTYIKKSASKTIKVQK